MPLLQTTGVPIMTRVIAIANEHEMMTETLLWRAVVAGAIQDWLSKPLRPKHEAERYLFTNSRDLSLVCHSAEINVLKLRTCLNKVRGRTLEGVLAVAA
jgi:hypothetical protein